MPRRAVIVIVLLAVAAVAAFWLAVGGNGARHYTGFVEGEERVLRSEVTGRVVSVAYAEGDVVPAGAIVAQLADDDIRTRVAAKEQQSAVQEADIRRQEEQVRLLETTLREAVRAREAELAQAIAADALARRSFERERALVESGASTAQILDEVRTTRDQARSAVTRARTLITEARAREGQVAVARAQLDVLQEQRALADAELAELAVTRAKYAITAPDVPTTVQTQFLWPGELAQPGSAVLAVLDPLDKYVQIYVPVADLADVGVGRRVEIELDSAPDRRVPGEVTFIADQATFTPEKIETRNDRLGQVYRAKVRILAEVASFKPGTEGNVYLVAAPDGHPQEQARDER
jgi:HlyD family secretion protein